MPLDEYSNRIFGELEVLANGLNEAELRLLASRFDAHLSKSTTEFIRAIRYKAVFFFRTRLGKVLPLWHLAQR